MFEFKLRPHTEAEVPDYKKAVESALEFVSTIKATWKKGKFYAHGGVQTYHTRIEGDFWMARVSHHELSYDTFEKYIYTNHTANEVEYIPLLHAFREVDNYDKDKLEKWYQVIVHYKFPKMFSDREMAVWILAYKPDPAKKQFVVISLPSNAEVSGDVTQALYCSIEVITESEDGTVEWLMAQTSDACGSIPRWIQDKSVTATVVEDVSNFLNWAKAQGE